MDSNDRNVELENTLNLKRSTRIICPGSTKHHPKLKPYIRVVSKCYLNSSSLGLYRLSLGSSFVSPHLPFSMPFPQAVSLLPEGQSSALSQAQNSAITLAKLHVIVVNSTGWQNWWLQQNTSSELISNHWEKTLK